VEEREDRIDAARRFSENTARPGASGALGREGLVMGVAKKAKRDAKAVKHKGKKDAGKVKHKGKKAKNAAKH
jgi:hypothetical protein